MRNSSRLAVGLIAAAAVAALALSGGAGAQVEPGAQPIRIAILDMNECWSPEKSSQAKALQAQLEDARNKLNAELGDLQAELKKKGDQLQTMKAGRDPLFTKLAMDFNMLEHRLKVTRDLGQRGLEDMRSKYRNELYLAARKMASNVAMEQKVDLVLRGDDDASEEDSITEMSSQKNLLRAVLYYQPALDITPAVLKRLNDEFNKAMCPTCKLAGVDGKCPKCGGALKN